ncbi:replication factor C small subunit [Haloplanus rubicundus]|uniref:Replication factor C small subunit n=1 Tax=Haloplanus rubicundus TaxID=1547898 RepID=A0A345DZI4_9EURY|nr:replication factor C small subunit [Haloplanus rubicundus]
MSDPEGATGREIWIEKYRPETLDDVKGQDDIVDRLRSYIAQDDLPHLLFSGPAGVGKCVTGETPVLTNRGVERIGDVVGEVDGFEEPDAGVEVLTFRDDGSFEFTTPSHVFGKTTDDLVRVTTRDGNDLTVTPEHRLLAVTHDGLEWVRAGNLSAGTRVVRPRRTPLPEGDGHLDWMDAMDGDRTVVHVTESFAADHDIPVEENYVGKKKRAVAGFRRGESDATIAAAAGTTTKTVRSYRRNLDTALDEPSTVCSLSYLRGLDVSRDELRTHVTAVQYVTRNNQRSEPITPPWELTPALASFVGLAVSEARIDGGRVKFYNTDDDLLDRFETVAESVFGLEPREGTQDDVPYRELHTRTLTHFLDACFDVGGGTVGIGSTLVRADEASRAAFLRAVFDAEAHVTEHGIIELTQKDEHLVTLLSYLLSGFGIPSRRKRERKAPTNGSGTAREYHTLYVSSARHLERFADHVGFTLDEKAERLATNAARDPNPNDDTVPTQAAVDTLCEQLYLTKGDYVPDSLNPDTPGREQYLDCVDELVDAATARLDDAQRTLERIDELAADLDAVAAIPATWIGTRGELEPIETRRTLAAQVGVRSDRLLEYADGRRTPSSDRTVELLDQLHEDGVDVEHVRATLRNAIETLDVPYAHVADGTDMHGTDVQSLLDGGNDLGSLTRFRTIADRVRSIASGLPSAAVLDALTTLHTLTSGDLYFDEVESVESVDEPRRVYDLTVPETRNYVAGGVPSVMHNTTCATAIAREVYGDDWRGNFLELNASDQRGIDVVRDRIKNFARASFGGFDYRIIFLDEADSLTDAAQSALRRTMEQFADNTRFILSCNYSSRIIDPIQSRCAVFRFSPLPDEAIAAQAREIAEAEGIEMTEDGLDALVYAAGGDMRRVINTLQAAATTGDVVDDEAVYLVTSTARPEEIESMVEAAIEGDFPRARSTLETLLVDSGMAGGDVIDQLHRSAWEFDLDDRRTVQLMERLGEADYRITEGANERVQLEAMLAALALEDE